MERGVDLIRAREAERIGNAYNIVQAQPTGPAHDPFVQIAPEENHGAIIARGGFAGMGDATVQGSGWGLVKFIWRHGEKSRKAPDHQISRDDLTSFPNIIRDYEPTRQATSGGQGREWRVSLPGPKGERRTIVFADNILTGRGNTPHLVSVYVQEAGRSGAASPLSQPRQLAGTPGSTEGSLEPPSGYRNEPFDQPSLGQGHRPIVI